MGPYDPEQVLKEFNCNPPASGLAIRQLEEEAGVRLPVEYVRFLQKANGGEGFIGRAYVILWPVEELLAMNRTYQVEEYASGLFIFGSDGGGESFGFDMRTDAKPIVSVPFIGGEWSVALPLGLNFEEFLEKLSTS